VLKSYFLSLEKCPIRLQNSFENPLSFTPLHFLAIQLKTFSHTIKCIEKQDTTVIEVKNEIIKLLYKLNCRKTERFLTTALREQLQELEEEGHITIKKLITM
jgi:patatin-like phospholipase/acyl hydrolase